MEIPFDYDNNFTRYNIPHLVKPLLPSNIKFCFRFQIPPQSFSSKCYENS